MGSLDGTCYCGKCKLHCDGPALKVVHCQCTDCQKLSGTGHLTNVLVKKGSASVSGPVANNEQMAESGNVNRRAFCSNCSCQMLRENSGMPDVQILHAGVFNNPDAVKIDAVIWHKSAIDWDFCDPALPMFAKMPPGA